jgi:hypothetical protein
MPIDNSMQVLDLYIIVIALVAERKRKRREFPTA